MKIKSYFSGTVEAALQLASRELGDEALLLNARPSSDEVRHLGAYEVVVGVADVPTPMSESNLDLADFLVRQDVMPHLAQEIARDFPKGSASDGEVRDSIGRRIRFDIPAIGAESLIAFTGPAGHGKTSTLLKLALRSTTRPVLIGGGTRRVGADEYLARVAAIADLPCELIEDVSSLPSLVEAYRHERPVLIDTPGVDETGEWAAAFSNIPKIQISLVLSAAVRSADLLLTAKRYSMFSPTHLIFTRIDEASQAGGIVSLAAETGLPISWFASGPSEIEDLEDASLPRVLDMLFQDTAQGTRAMTTAGGAR